MGIKKRKGASKSNGQWTGGTFEDAVKIYVGTVEVQKIFKGRGRLLEDFTASPGSPGSPGDPSSPSPSPTPASVPGGIDNTLATGGLGVLCSAFGYSYPSSTWSTLSSIPSTIYCRGNAFGDKSGAHFMGLDCHHEYNGVSWSTATNVPVCRRFQGAGGSTNAGMNWSGCVAPTTSCNGESWNGSAWSTLPSSPSAGYGKLPTAGGTQNSFFSFGGNSASPYAGYYDGTSWTACTQAPYINYTEGFGTIDSAVNFLCDSGNSTNPTSEWNGTSWGTGITHPDTAWAGGAGTGASEGLTAGKAPSCFACTYEYTSPTYSTGGNLPIGGFHISVTS